MINCVTRAGEPGWAGRRTAARRARGRGALPAGPCLMALPSAPCPVPRATAATQGQGRICLINAGPADRAGLFARLPRVMPRGVLLGPLVEPLQPGRRQPL